MSESGLAVYGRRNLPGMNSGVRLQGGDLADHALNERKMSRRHLWLPFRTQPQAMLKGNTGAVASGLTGSVNLLSWPEGQIEQHILGAGQTIIVPIVEADGLLASLDLVNNEGAEYCAGLVARNPGVFTIGTDPAFFVRARIKVADVSGSDELAVGFRKNQAYQANLDDYTDMAALNKIGGDLFIETILNNAATTSTDTTENWLDTETHELEVRVSAAGVVTYRFDGEAPATVAAFAFDTGDVVTAFCHILHDATTPGAIHIDYLESGFQVEAAA